MKEGYGKWTLERKKKATGLESASKKEIGCKTL